MDIVGHHYECLSEYVHSIFQYFSVEKALYL